MKVALLIAPLLVAGCAPGSTPTPKTPAQQAADFTEATACIVSHWGEPVVQLAVDCLAGEEQAAVDIVADIGFLLEKNPPAPGGVPATNPTLPMEYQKDTRVMAALTKKRQAFSTPKAVPSP